MKKILAIISLTLIILFIYITNVYADTGVVNLSSNTNVVNNGNTVEVYIDLNTNSVAYDIFIEVEDENIVETSELVNTLGEGDSKRIYLVQLKDKENRIIYDPGTRIATLKYKIKENFKEGNNLVVKVKGDVVGKTSEEKNPFEEEIKIPIVEKTDSLDPSSDNKPSDKKTSDGNSSDAITQNKSDVKISKVIKQKIADILPNTGSKSVLKVLLIGLVGVVIFNIIFIKFVNRKK